LYISTKATTLLAGYEISTSQALFGRKKLPDKQGAQSAAPQFKDWNIAVSLDFLATNFIRGGTNRREMRAGMAQTMVLYLQQISSKVIRTHMSMIIQKILDLITNAAMKNYTSLSELLQAYGCVSHVLNAGLRGHLGEEGQQKMALVLSQVLSKPGNNEYVLILALRQLR
jgi:hypothetical protein